MDKEKKREMIERVLKKAIASHAGWMKWEMISVYEVAEALAEMIIVPVEVEHKEEHDEPGTYIYDQTRHDYLQGFLHGYHGIPGEGYAIIIPDMEKEEMLAEYAEAAELNRTLAEEHMEAFGEILAPDEEEPSEDNFRKEPTNDWGRANLRRV